jgi:MerR family transcriptional regulator, mercuric resistance operon regulatory protein
MPIQEGSATSAFQIGELAKRSRLSVDAIRFYERRKLLSTPIRTTGRFRLYTENDVEQLRFIRQMQTLGFSLSEITRLAQLRADKSHACESVREFLKAKLAEVAVKIQELQQVEAELKADLRKCNHALAHRRGKKACACPVLEGTEISHQ